MKKQFLLGLMAMTLPWTAWAQTATVTGNAEITYDGGKTQPVFEVKLNSGRVLDLGKDYKVVYEFTPVYETTPEAEQRDTVTDAGTYKATIVGFGDFDGFVKVEVETPIVVERKELTNVTLSNTLSKKYGTKDEDIDLDTYVVIGEGLVTDVTDAQAERANALKCLTLLPTEYNGENVGETRKVLVGGVSNPKSNYIYNVQAGNETAYVVNITPRQLTIDLKDANSSHIYRSNGTSLAWLADKANQAFTFGGDDIANNDDVTIKFEVKDNTALTTIKNAGEYTLVPTITSAAPTTTNYTITNEPTYTIEKATLTITPKDGETFSSIYDNTVTAESTVTVTDKFDFEINSTTGEDPKEDLHLSMKYTKGVNADSYDINPYVTVDKNDQLLTMTEGKYEGELLPNYIVEYEGKSFDIEKKSLADLTVTIAEEELIYQGQTNNFTLQNTKEITQITVMDGTKALTLGTDYTTEVVPVVEGGEVKDAGTLFTVNIKAGENSNYKDKKENIKPENKDGYEVLRATLTIKAKEDVKFEGTYTGKAVGALEIDDYFDVEGVVNNEAYDFIGLSMRVNAKDVDITGTENNHIVHVYNGESLIGSSKYSTAFTNYAVEYKTRPYYTITPATLLYWIAAEGNGKTYSSAALPAAGADEFKIATEGWLEEGDVVWTQKPIVDFADRTKQIRSVGSYELVILNEEKTEQYEAVSAGDNYTVMHQLPENVEEEGQYVITPAELTITALDQTIQYKKETVLLDITEESVFFGNAKPTDKKYNVWVKGRQFTGESNDIISQLGESLAYDAEEGVDLAQKVGTHEEGIVFALTEEEINESKKGWLANYNITLDFGTLTVTGVDEITLDRDAVDNEEEGTESVATTLAAYNGAENMTVILGGNRDLKADYWYTLVLPFETSVREISNAFGYAVVNVPNENNTDAGVVSFKLKVDAEKIPANTLILIKTDEAINLQDQIGKEAAVKFGGKTIDYNPEYYTSDAAGNEYHGVYENTELQEDGYWYLSGGKFYNAGAYYRAYKVPVSISALGGYVYAVAGAAARILVEEPDGSTTSINTITGETTNSADSWYSVGGMKLNAQPTQKGVYINNGKKVVIK